MQDEKTTYDLPYTLTLKYPVQITETRTLEELVFTSAPTAGMMENIPIGGEQIKAGTWIPVIAAMTGQPVPVIRKIAFRDYSKAVELVVSFLAD